MNNFHETLINQLAKESSFVSEDDKRLTREFYEIKENKEVLQTKADL